MARREEFWEHSCLVRLLLTKRPPGGVHANEGTAETHIANQAKWITTKSPKHGYVPDYFVVNGDVDDNAGRVCP